MQALKLYDGTHLTEVHKPVFVFQMNGSRVFPKLITPLLLLKSLDQVSTIGSDVILFIRMIPVRTSVFILSHQFNMHYRDILTFNFINAIS